jgi:hypothetical protein
MMPIGEAISKIAVKLLVFENLTFVNARWPVLQ